MNQLTVYQSIIDNYLEVQNVAIRFMLESKSIVFWSDYLKIARGTVYKKMETKTFTTTELTHILKLN